LAYSAIFPRSRVTIVGVLNTTPDSFSDGGRFIGEGERVNVDAAVDAAAALVRDGAHVLDVGGESTRPGARSVPASLEIDRTAALIEALTKRFDQPISIDTRKAAVAASAIAAGARIVNDVSGLAFDPRLAEVAATAGVELIVGHSRGTPETMQRDPSYADAVVEVTTELGASVARARAAGVPDDHLVVDPGIGFGKRLEDNLALLAHPGRIREALGFPVLVGPSRKSFLGLLTGDPPSDRDAASAAACAVAVFAGADAVRVHDAAGAARAVAVARALREARCAAPTIDGERADGPPSDGHGADAPPNDGHGADGLPVGGQGEGGGAA
jgi:dihydropteroate synthase